MLSLLTLGCAGPGSVDPPPRTQVTAHRARSSARPPVKCPEFKPAAAPSRPTGPATALLYPDAEGWFCIDDPAVEGRNSDGSYCWFKKVDCEQAYGLFLGTRPTVKPCRPESSVHCYNKYSSLLQVRRSLCSATLEHCEGMRNVDSKASLPEDGYVFSSCTEQP